jgi:hypothetical protein
MMTVFVVCAIVGGILILLGLLGADHSADFHTGTDLALSHDIGELSGFLHDLPFFSLRFWSYGLAVFGAAGYILMTMARMSPTLAAVFAGAVGLTSGLTVVYSIRAVSRQLVSSGASIDELLGSEALVTVAVRGETPGRIRCTLKGEIIDLLAVTDPGTSLEPGSSFIIANIENDRARIMPRSALYNSDSITVNS